MHVIVCASGMNLALYAFPSENCFLSLPDNPCTLTPALGGIAELSINKMQLAWGQVRDVSDFPPITNLFQCIHTTIRSFCIFVAIHVYVGMQHWLHVSKTRAALLL